VLSAIALGRSAEANELAAQANNRTLPTAAETPRTEPAATDPDSAASPTDISPTAQFTVAYEGEHLRVRSIRCDFSNTYAFVDLDDPPRVAGTAEANTEFGYAGCEPGKIQTNLPFAQVSGPTATPKDCLETIRTDPGRSPIAPTPGMTLCILTDQNEAAAQGINQRLVFVTIDSISVDNNIGGLNITAKAWDVPQ
jgi:hypothetical protein